MIEEQILIDEEEDRITREQQEVYEVKKRNSTEFEVDGVTFVEVLEEYSPTAMNGGYGGYIELKMLGNHDWKIQFQSGWYETPEFELYGWDMSAWPMNYTYTKVDGQKEHSRVDDIHSRIEAHTIYIRNHVIYSLKNRILWFSRHEMTKEQKIDLFRIYGPAEIVQISKTIQNAYELQDDIKTCHVVAVVAPTNLQEQFLKIAGTKPVISCRNRRVLTKSEDGTEDKVQFIFDGWFQIDEVRVITHDL